MDAESPSPANVRPALGTRVAGSAALLWALQMVLRGLQFVTLIVLARLLTPADFGIAAMATTVIGVLDVLTNVQVGSAIIRQTSLADGHLDTAFTLNLLRGLLTAVILCAGAVPIARFVEMPAVEPLLYALAIPAVINSVSNPHFILYARNLDFRREVIRRSIGAACGSVAAIAIAVALHSYWALIASTFVQAIVSVALSYWKVPGRPRLSLSHQREMLGFGGWLLIGNMLSYFALRLEYFYIGKLMDARTLGAYHVGNQVNSLSTADVVPTLSRAMFPALSMLQREPERLHRTYVQMQAVSLAISLPIGFGLALVARPLVLLLFGRGWEEAVLVVQTITPIAALQAVGAGVEALAMATNRVRKLAARSFVYVVVRTVAQFAGFWTGGLAGLLLGRAVAGLFQALYGLSLAASLTGRSIAEPLIASWRSFAAVAVMSAGLWFWPAHDVAAAVAPALMADVAMRVVAGGVLYVGTHLLLWQIAGRPAGAEALLLRQAARLSGQAVSRFRAGA